MSDNTTEPTALWARRDDLVADCLDAVAASPHFAAELRELLDDREQFCRLAPPSAYRGDDPGSTLPPTSRFGPYELCGVIDYGGMGTVYRALDTRTGQTFALKVIHQGRLGNPDAVRRFLANYRIAAQLHHPNIVPVHDVGEQDGQPYFTMTLIEGVSLARQVADSPLASREAARLLAKVARAVHYAHEQGVIHRDLKPGNVLLDPEGEPHVIDFDLAKLLGGNDPSTTPGLVIGTVNYLAPEQAAGRSGEPSPAIDVYGLGALLYVLLTGRPPFRAETLGETLRQTIDLPPVPPQLHNPAIDTDLQTICLKCLSKRPADRYASAREVADDLDRYLARRPVAARAPNLWHYIVAALRSVDISARERRAWGNILLGGGLVGLAQHLTLFALDRAGAPLPVLWSAAAAWWLPMAAMIWHFLGRGEQPLSPSDRTTLLMWGGNALGSLLLLALGHPPGALAAWYPSMAVLTGYPFLIDANLRWGRSYLIGLGFMALAVPLWLLPAWSPLIFALFGAGFLTYLGFAFRRSAA